MVKESDITLILFHGDSPQPPHLEYAIKQIRLFNPCINLICLSDSDVYYSDKVSRLEEVLGRRHNDFWGITATRLIYIENFIRQTGLTNVYHIENDVLLYYPLIQHHELFCNLYKDMAITVGGDDKAMTGFMFISRYEKLSEMTQFFIDILSQYGCDGVKDKYGMDMVNEMTLMRAYQKEGGKLESLPILPFGEWSSHYDKFNSIFDPASWGQYVGGTLDGVPGAKPQDHYIGRLLEKNPDYTVIWHTEDDKRIPYFKYDNNEIKINNLHIHSKNLYKYIS